MTPKAGNAINARNAINAPMTYVCNGCERVMTHNANHCKDCEKRLFQNVQRTIAKVPIYNSGSVGCGNCVHHIQCINCTTSAGVCRGPHGIVIMKASRRDPWGQTLYLSGWDIGPGGNSMLYINSKGLLRRRLVRRH